MKKLPIGIQTFSRLITENHIYVDKTAFIYQLVTEGSCYFLSRPRRFGKSLLVSTLESLFSGNKDSDFYTLGFPNKENTRSLVEYIFASMTEISSTYLYNTAAALKKIFDTHLYEQLEPILTQLYATIPYTIHIDQKRYYQTIFYTALKIIGAHIIVEQATNVGCMDAILETKDTYFIIEFKINKPAHKALEQIKKKKYYQPYEMQGKNIVLIGISFDTTQKNISGIEYEKYC